MVVQHNMQAMNSNRMLGITSKAMAKVTEKLASGYKVNRAADDAAGLAISEKMRKQIRGLTQASLNAQDGISAVQTAEGALGEVHDMIQRMNELAVKSANGTNSQEERDYIQLEVDKLTTEIDRVAETTKFNELYLLKGDTDKATVVTTPGISGVINNKITSGTEIGATGNKFTAAIDSANALAEGTTDYIIIEYIDNDGRKIDAGKDIKDANGIATGEKGVEFKAGINAKATAANIAKALNDDADFSQVFKASVTTAGELSIESIKDGTETETTKNKINSINFNSGLAAPAGAGGLTYVTKFKGQAAGTASAAQAAVTYGTNPKFFADANSGGIQLQITKNDGAIAKDKDATDGTAPTFNLVAGDAVTIDGKTYTFDPTKVTNKNSNTFKSLDDLQKILGDNFEVGIQVNATKVNKVYTCTTAGSTTVSAAWDDGKEVKIQYSQFLKNEVGQDTALNAAAAGTDFGVSGDMIATDIKGVDDSSNRPTAKTVGPKVGDTSTDVTFENVSYSLAIIRKSAPEETRDISTLKFNLHVGAESADTNKIAVDIKAMDSVSIGLRNDKRGKVDVSSEKAATATIDKLNAALRNVSEQRSNLGATQNRLEHTITNLDNVVENTTSAESQIRDTDMASMMVKYANNQILAQAGQAMLAQSNQANQGVLSLLQ